MLITSPDYWRLWLVGFVQSLTRWLDTLVMSVYIYQQTGSAFLVSMVSVMRFLPMGLFGAFIATFAERMSRWSVLAAMNTTLLLCALVLALLAHLGLLQIWHLYATSFLAGITTTLENPVRRLMIGDVVGSARFGSAISIDIATSNGTRMAGPFAGGIILATWGIEEVFLLDALLYSVALVAGLMIRHRVQARAAAQEPMMARLREAWAICRNDPRLMGFMLMTIFFNLFVFPYVSMVPVIGADTLRLNTAQIGILGGMDGLGSVLGALGIAMLVQQAKHPRVYVFSIIGGHVAAIIFALLGQPLLAGAALIVLGVGVAGFSVTQTTLVYMLPPPDARARVMGLLSVAIGINPLGFLLVGALADWIGPSYAMAGLSSTGIVVIVLSRRYWLPLLAPPAQTPP